MINNEQNDMFFSTDSSHNEVICNKIREKGKLKPVQVIIHQWYKEKKMKSDIKKNIFISVVIIAMISFLPSGYGCAEKESSDGQEDDIVLESVETLGETTMTGTEIPSVSEGSESKETESKEAESEKTVEIPDSVYAGNPDSQPELIADWYDVLTDYVNKEMSGPFFHRIAITDLNHNGRLEIMISSIQGSGHCSDTAMFEVDENYSSLIQLKAKGNSDLAWDSDLDRNGDFVSYDDFCCYKKGDRYYYPVENFGSGGWDSKQDSLCSYTFDGGINNSQIVRYILSADSPGNKLIHVYLYDSDNALIPDENDYRDILNNYWNDYEKYSTVSVKWVVYPESKEESLTSIQESFDGYSEKEFRKTDYFQDFRSVYGDGFEYRIETVDIKGD